MAEDPKQIPALAAPTEDGGEGGEKVSKRALDKAKKKAEKAAKKAEHKTEQVALRPKTEGKSSEPTSIFAQGWLKKTYESRKCEQVRTRFPPEPNGFLHIGHAKAIAVNFGFAKYYNGICFLRFDDTNPDKEEEIFFIKIKEIIEWLGFKPYEITHSSDHFDKLYDLAEEMIRRDKAYVCYCSKEEVNMQRGGPDNRGERFACAHRDRPTEESLSEFRAMRDGKYKPGEAVLRMKQKLTDPTEGNPQMWDLAAYRVMQNTHHPRTGDKWKIYPTYDYTHCICDAFEEISHSMCTTEFLLSRVSYDWLLEVLDMKIPGSDEKGPMQREYGRLNIAGTILSKRRITMLVNGAKVEIKDADGKVSTKQIPPAVKGWDDPRLYTLVAIRRRGVPAKALLQFVEDLGVTDSLTNIQPYKFENTIRKYLERNVPRVMLVLDPIKIVIDDLPDDHIEEISIPYDPKQPDGAKRQVRFTKTVYIDRTDFIDQDDPNFFRLAPGKTVGLMNSAVIRATSFEKDSKTGKVTVVHASTAPEGEKPKAFIQWVGDNGIKVRARQYNVLFNAEEPNSLDWKTGGYADSLNPDSEVVFDDALIESGFAQLRAEHAEKPSGSSDDLVRFQAIRTGYFCVDTDSTADAIVLNQIVSLKEDSSKGK